MLSKAELYDNLIFLAKERGYQIGEFEKKIGYSVGYFVRSKKQNANATPNIELFYKCAEVFGFNELSELFKELENTRNKMICPVCRKEIMTKENGKYHCDKCNIEFKFGSDEE